MNKMTVTLSLCISLLSGCSGNGSERTETSVEVIQVEEALKRPEKILVSDLGENTVYVPLETTDSSLINISLTSTTRVTNDVILIGTKNHPIKVFDKKTGRYLRKIGDIGNGPGEYTLGNFFHVDAKTNKVYVEASPQKRHVYSTNGDFIETITYELPTGTLTASLFWDDKLYSFVTIPSPHTTCFSAIYDFQTQSKLDSLFLSSDNIPASEIEFVLPLSGMETFGGRAFLMKVKEQLVCFGNRESSPFWNYKDEVRLKDVYSDTIFTIKNSLKDKHPRYIFNLGKWGGFKRYEKENNMADKLVITRILETDQLIYFSMLRNMYDISNWMKRIFPPIYIGIYNKKSGTIKIAENLDIKSNMAGFPDFRVHNISTDDELIVCYQAEDLVNARNEIPESEQPDWLKRLKEDDNPVIMIIK